MFTITAYISENKKHPFLKTIVDYEYFVNKSQKLCIYFFGKQEMEKLKRIFINIIMKGGVC